jgi:hypothetical protein
MIFFPRVRKEETLQPGGPSYTVLGNSTTYLIKIRRLLPPMMNFSGTHHISVAPNTSLACNGHSLFRPKLPAKERINGEIQGESPLRGGAGSNPRTRRNTHSLRRVRTAGTLLYSLFLVERPSVTGFLGLFGRRA